MENNMSVEQWLHKVQKEQEWLDSVESWDNYNAVIEAYNDLWYIVNQGVEVIKKPQSENIHLLALNLELEENNKELSLSKEQLWVAGQIIEELREEVAFYKQKEINLLTELKRIENGE